MEATVAGIEVTVGAEQLFSLFVLFVVPIGLLAFIRPVGRLVFGCAGLLFMVVTDATLPAYGPDNPMLVIPFLGAILALDAVVAELIVRLVRWLRGRRRPRPE